MKNIEREILELRNEKIGYKRIAKMLGIGGQKVSDILIKNGITDHVIMPDVDTVKSIVNDYENGMSILDCKKKYKKREISSILRIAGCRVRPTFFHKNYEERLNHDFFEKIDTEEKAYILGFLYADGYINEKKTCIEISLAIKDEEILHKINKAMNSIKNIEYRIVKAFDGEFPSARLTLYSKKLVDDIKDKGCFPQKTYTLISPLDEIFIGDLKRHFIRGYFDGDGCICQNIVGFVGTRNILDYIIDDLISNAGIKDTGHFSMTGAAHQWSHNCKEDIPKIFNYFYKDSNIYLERKFNKFLEIMNCRSSSKLQKN